MRRKAFNEKFSDFSKKKTRHKNIYKFPRSMPLVFNLNNVTGSKFLVT